MEVLVGTSKNSFKDIKVIERFMLVIKILWEVYNGIRQNICLPVTCSHKNVDNSEHGGPEKAEQLYSVY